MAKDTYLTLGAPCTGQYKDRGSRFLAFAWPVGSEEEAKEKLDELKKKYHDARHHCYAFRLGPGHETYRYSDDGEPSGTAGRPVYEQILSANLYNVIVVVVRYFGGVLLGTGGLHHAYKQAARDALAHARIVEKIMEEQVVLSFGYDRMNLVMQTIDREHLTIVDQHFGDTCRIVLRVRKNVTDRIRRVFEAAGGVNIEKK